MTQTSIKNIQALQTLNSKLLKIMNDRGLLATYLMSPLSKITNPENSSQFKLVKDINSNRGNDLKINKTITNTLYNKLLTYRDTGREFELKGDLLRMITNKNYNVDLARLSDKKLINDFAKELNFDLKAQSNKSTRDKTLKIFFKSPSSMVFASGVSKTLLLSSDPDELCNSLKLLLQEKHAGNNSDMNKDEIVAIVDKLLEHKCIYQKQHKQLLIKCKLLHE